MEEKLFPGGYDGSPLAFTGVLPVTRRERNMSHENFIHLLIHRVVFIIDFYAHTTIEKMYSILILRQNKFNVIMALYYAYQYIE